MAQKHKSKYKAPKDLEKSQKPKTRKDLKDYTHDDKKGALNPKSTGDAQLNVLRKRDKEMVDTGDMYVKYNADDRLYKDLEDGEWEPKHAAKVLKKRQDKDEKDNEKNIQDKIENLTREQKERLVREYVRRKIVKILKEAEEPQEAAPEEEAPETTETPAATETPTADPNAAATADISTAPATPEAGTAPTTPDAASMAPPTTTGAETTPTTPATTATPAAAAPSTTPETGTTQPAAQQPTPEELENRALTNAAKELEKEGGVGKIKAISKILGMSMKETDPADQANFYRMLRGYAIKKLGKLQSEPTKK